MAVAVREAPRSIPEMSVAVQAFYSRAMDMLHTIHRYESTTHHKVSTRVLLPVVFSLAVVLGGCSGMDAYQMINSAQAAESGLPTGTLTIGSSGVDLPFILTHATDSAVAQAKQSGATDQDIVAQLKRVNRQINAFAQGPVTAELNCSQGGSLTQSNCDIKVHGTGDGIGRVTIRESECTVNPYDNQNVCARPLEYAFNVDSHITPPALNMGFQLSPDGKTMQVIGAAQDPAGIKPDSVRVATCSDKKAIPVSGTTDHAVASTPLKPGENCYVFSADDTRGNHAEAMGKYGYQFDLGINPNPALDADGKINITGAVANNTFKVGTVTLAHCDSLEGNQDLSAVTQVKPDGSFAGKIKPVPGNNGCVEAIATDSQGIQVISQNRNLITYQLDSGLVAPLRDPNNPQLWYLLGNPSSNMDSESVRAQGSQPMWKQFGATGNFTCDHLPGGAKIGDQTFTYALRCTLPSSAGQALVTFNIFDKNGYGMSASYNLPMPADPTTGELFDYFGPPLIASLLLATALAGTGLYVRESMRRNKAIDSVRKTYKSGDFIGAANLLSTLRIGMDLKTSLGEEITLAECNAAQNLLHQSLISASSGYMNGNLNHVLKDTDQLNFLLGHENFARDPAVTRAFFARLHDWSDRNLHPSQLPLSWKELETEAGSKNPDTGVMMRHMSRILTNERFRRVREQIQVYDKETRGDDAVHKNGPLLQQMNEIALMYELNHGRLFKPEVFRPLVLQGMGIEEAVRTMWKWGSYEAINGPMKRMSAQYGQPDAVEKAVRKITRT